MTQTGQNSAVRRRDKMVMRLKSIINDPCDHHRGVLAQKHIDQAMALGAEEQRRKDAEFAKLIADKSAKIRLLVEDLQPQDGDYAEEVPANVAALEARVKVLEEAIEEYFEARDGCEVSCVSRTGQPEQRAKEKARSALRAALTREGGE